MKGAVVEVVGHAQGVPAGKHRTGKSSVSNDGFDFMSVLSTLLAEDNANLDVNLQEVDVQHILQTLISTGDKEKIHQELKHLLEKDLKKDLDIQKKPLFSSISDLHLTQKDMLALMMALLSAQDSKLSPDMQEELRKIVEDVMVDAKAHDGKQIKPQQEKEKAPPYQELNSKSNDAAGVNTDASEGKVVVSGFLHQTTASDGYKNDNKNVLSSGERNLVTGFIEIAQDQSEEASARTDSKQMMVNGVDKGHHTSEDIAKDSEKHKTTNETVAVPEGKKKIFTGPADDDVAMPMSIDKEAFSHKVKVANLEKNIHVDKGPGRYEITDPVDVIPITSDEWEEEHKDLIIDKEFMREAAKKLQMQMEDGKSVSSNESEKEDKTRMVDKGNVNNLQKSHSRDGGKVAKENMLMDAKVNANKTVNSTKTGMVNKLHVDGNKAMLPNKGRIESNLSSNVKDAHSGNTNNNADKISQQNVFQNTLHKQVREESNHGVVFQQEVKEDVLKDNEDKAVHESKQVDLGSEKVAKAEHASVHTNVPETHAREDANDASAKHNVVNNDTLAKFTRAVEIMKSRHKYPSYLAVRVDDKIVKMKLSFDVEKGEFWLEMSTDKDLAKTIHGIKHSLVNALMDKDIHVKDIKVYVSTGSSEMNFRYDSKHFFGGFMSSGGFHEYRHQKKYSEWVKAVYSWKEDYASFVAQSVSNRQSSRNIGDGSINIYA